MALEHDEDGFRAPPAARARPAARVEREAPSCGARAQLLQSQAIVLVQLEVELLFDGFVGEIVETGDTAWMGQIQGLRRADSRASAVPDGNLFEAHIELPL